MVIDVVTSPSGMPSKRSSKSREGRDRDALLADLAAAHRVVGVVAHERGHVEGGREPVHAVLEQVLEARVRVLGRPEAGELAHRPEPAAVHRRLRAARERVPAGVAHVAQVVGLAHARRIEHVGDRDPGVGLEPLPCGAGACASDLGELPSRPRLARREDPLELLARNVRSVRSARSGAASGVSLAARRTVLRVCVRMRESLATLTRSPRSRAAQMPIRCLAREATRGGPTGEARRGRRGAGVRGRQYWP